MIWGYHKCFLWLGTTFGGYTVLYYSLYSNLMFLISANKGFHLFVIEQRLDTSAGTNNFWDDEVRLVDCR